MRARRERMFEDPADAQKFFKRKAGAHRDRRQRRKKPRCIARRRAWELED